MNVSPTVEGEMKEKFMTYPRALMYAENRDEATVLTEKTGLLEKLLCDCASSPDHKWEEKLTLSLLDGYTKALPLLNHRR